MFVLKYLPSSLFVPRHLGLGVGQKGAEIGTILVV